MQDIKKTFLLNTPIAHRGLWNENFIENSLLAYQNAIDNGFAIEIDLYLSTDNVLYSFHDKTLDRMTGEKGFIYQKSSSEIEKLSLLDSDHKIPTFKQVLDLVDGKVPLLIEIKNQPNKKIVERVVNALKDYKGEYAIQSFNPIYLLKLKKIAPYIVRGILSTNEKEHLKHEKPLTRFIIKNMSLNFLVKPNFISYNKNGFPLKKRKIKNKIVLAWTVLSANEHKKISPFIDNIIFEGFTPKK